MAEEYYVNKNGFKCVRWQLAKTDGMDPQLHGAITAKYAMTPVANRDLAWTQAKAAELAALPIVAVEYSLEGSP